MPGKDGFMEAPDGEISSGHSSPIYLADKFFYQSVYFIRLVRIGIMTSILYPFKR